MLVLPGGMERTEKEFRELFAASGGGDTAAVAFVVDDLGGWLVGLLADAGRKKLTALVLGSEQERALRRAATAAIQSTAARLAPSSNVPAERLEMVVGEVFRGVPGAALAGRGTLLEALQAGIAAQLAVLDDPGLTGTGQSSAEELGVSGQRAGRGAGQASGPRNHAPRLGRRAAGAAGRPAEP